MTQFNIGSASEFFIPVVKPLHEEFSRDNCKVEKAMAAIVLAYQMYEWANGEKFTVDKFKRRYPADEELATVFDTARQIANWVNWGIRSHCRFQRPFCSALVLIQDE